MSAKHTPQPWELGELDRNEQRQVVGPDGRLIAVVVHECLGSRVSEMEANARLIVQAPAMVKIVRALADRFPDSSSGVKAIAILAAIEGG